MDSARRGLMSGARRRETRALAASVVFHLVVLTALFTAASSPLVTGAAGGASVLAPMEVALVRRPHHAEAAAEPTAAQALQPLFAKFQVATDQAPIPIAKGQASSGFSGLVERLTQHEPAAPPRPRPVHATTPLDDDPDEAPPATAKSISPQDAVGAAAAQKAKGVTTGSASSGRLWGRIAPCWRDLGVSARVPVTLEVEFDRAGHLSKPPTILRPQLAPVTEARLRAEGRALAALAACLPQGDFQLAGSVQRLEFGAGG